MTHTALALDHVWSVVRITIVNLIEIASTILPGPNGAGVAMAPEDIRIDVMNDDSLNIRCAFRRDGVTGE